MLLTYRGQQYTATNTTVEMIDTGLTATFRGAAYSVQRAASLNFPAANLMYRGVTYTQTPNAKVAEPALTPVFS